MQTARVLCLAAFVLAAATAAAQRFDVQPPGADVVAGEPLAIAVGGLAAGREVDIVAERGVRDARGRVLHRAQARFTAGPDGRIDLAAQAPHAGTYAGADLRGLFWSMVPAAGSSEGLEDGEVRLAVRDGEQVLARQTVFVRAAARDLQVRDAAPFPGARLVARPGATRRPALIVLGGSEGGSAGIALPSRWLASHGYAVLALPYYSPGGWGPNGPTPPEIPQLPAAFADIPVDRLQAARDWLAGQPEVDADRIGLYGISKGAEFVLIAATRMAWPKAVVALVPSDVVWEGWGPGVEGGKRSSFSWQGAPLPFVPYRGFEEEFRGFQTGAPVIVRRPQDRGRAAHPDRVAAARIPVERYAGPLLVAGSHDDQVWDSGGMAQAIARARSAAGRETVALVFRDAGHALGGHGWAPTTQYNAGPMKVGGTPEADARAQAETAARTLEFLQRSLGR